MITTGSSAVLRAILLELCSELRSALERNTARSHALPAPQVMRTLGFLASGAFQRELANRLALCQSTLSRAMPAEWEVSASQQEYQIPTMQANMQSELSTAHTVL